MPIIETVEFDAPSHTYKIKGRHVPSVSAVLAPWVNFDQVPLDVLEKARQRGQDVAAACHLHNMGDLHFDSLEADVAAYIRGYRKFLVDSGLVVIASETRVASVKYGFAGTLDIYGILKRGEAMIDTKATAVLPRTVGAQTAAYKLALEETTGQKSKRRYCLHLKPDAYKLVEVSDGPGIQDWTIFQSALNMYKAWGAATPSC